MPPSAGAIRRFGGKNSQEMEARPRNRSWGDYLLDAICIGMIVISITGMLYLLSHR